MTVPPSERSRSQCPHDLLGPTLVWVPFLRTGHQADRRQAQRIDWAPLNEHLRTFTLANMFPLDPLDLGQRLVSRIGGGGSRAANRRLKWLNIRKRCGSVVEKLLLFLATRLRAELWRRLQILMLSPAEAQTSATPAAPETPKSGTERRQDRRTGRAERRQERRTGRAERREERRTGREERRNAREGTTEPKK